VTCYPEVPRKGHLFSLLLLAATPVLASDYVLEVSVVTDWETVTHYGSQAETSNKISTTIEYADVLFRNQLDLPIEVTYIDIPQTANDDVLAKHTHPEFLMDSLFEYRINNQQHMAADVTVLLTSRKLSTGGSNYVGYANIQSVCSAGALVIVSLYDSGLDGQTLAHELAHVLGAVHDGEHPCEATPSRGYLMSTATHTGNDNLSQCSIDTIASTLEVFGSCLVAVEPEVIVTPPARSGGTGSTGMVFLGMLLIVCIVRRASA